MKYALLSGLLLVLSQTHAAAQEDRLFIPVYPIGAHPNIGYKTSMVPDQEHILFEANPVLRLPIYNNIRRHLMNGKDRASTLYLNFRPQLRMYTDNSRPVKTPTYRISILGYQQMFRLPVKTKGKDQFLSFSIESGHYSNGQAQCAFDPDVDDGSPACDSVYQTIGPDTDLSSRLNRESGNFSTNYTELLLNYRIYTRLDEDYIPLRGFSFTAGLDYFHNNLLFLADIGGYTPEDIAIYGKQRWVLGAEGFTTLGPDSWCRQKLALDRMALNVQFEYIVRPHASVDPLRLELTATAYFRNHVGIFVSGIHGHDNYNYRFVDKGNQLFAGITFDMFPPLEIK